MTREEWLRRERIEKEREDLEWTAEQRKKRRFRDSFQDSAPSGPWWPIVLCGILGPIALILVIPVLAVFATFGEMNRKTFLFSLLASVLSTASCVLRMAV